MASPLYEKPPKEQPSPGPDGSTAAPARVYLCCGKPVGKIPKQKEALEAIRKAKPLLRKPRDKRDEEALWRARQFRLGPFTIAVALNVSMETIKESPGDLLNEIAVNQDFRKWLRGAAMDPLGTEQSLNELAHVVADVSNVFPKIVPLVTALKAAQGAGGTQRETLETTAWPCFLAFVAALVAKLVVAPLLDTAFAKEAAKALVSGGVRRLEFRDYCGCAVDCGSGCSCVVS